MIDVTNGKKMTVLCINREISNIIGQSHKMGKANTVETKADINQYTQESTANVEIEIN